MSDILLNEEFKSDKFEISINELIFTKRVKPSVSYLKNLLEDNGYYGRVDIETVNSRKFGIDVLVKVHVYLYDSGYTYTWPYQTFFNLDKKTFGSARKLPRGILNDKNIFITCCKNISGMFTPKNRMQTPISFSDIRSLSAMEEVSKLNAGLDRWPFIICKHHESFNLLPYYEKLIPFLCRVGLISNNSFKIKTKGDAEELCLNLFDVNYWYNI